MVSWWSRCAVAGQLFRIEGRRDALGRKTSIELSNHMPMNDRAQAPFRPRLQHVKSDFPLRAKGRGNDPHDHNVLALAHAPGRGAARDQ